MKTLIIITLLFWSIHAGRVFEYLQTIESKTELKAELAFHQGEYNEKIKIQAMLASLPIRAMKK